MQQVHAQAVTEASAPAASAATSGALAILCCSFHSYMVLDAWAAYTGVACLIGSQVTKVVRPSLEKAVTH